MQEIDFKSPIKMSMRNAINISKYADKLGGHLKIGKTETTRRSCVNSLLGLLSTDIKKNDHVTLMCDEDGEQAKSKLLEMKRAIEALA